MSFKPIGGRFKFGIDIDDMWRYAGIPDPPSVVIPFLLTRKTYNGEFSLPPAAGVRRTHGRGERTDSLVMEENSHDTSRLSRKVAVFIKKSGIDYVRCWFPWNFFESDIEEGFQFPLDDFVRAMHEAGVGIVAVVGDGYRRFVPRGAKTSDIDAYIKQLVKSSEEIVDHYKGRIDVWQIENEPNSWAGQAMVDWRSGAIWFAPSSREKILGALAAVVRSESPRSKIIINIDYLGLKVDWRMYERYCDMIGLDLYPSYINPYATAVAGIGNLAEQVGKETDMPIYIIETGYPTGPRLLGFSSARQAEYVSSVCRQASSCEKLSGLGIYRFADSYWDSFPPQENHFGLLTVQGEPKPAWNEYVRQIRRAHGR